MKLLHRGWAEDGIIYQYTLCFGIKVIAHVGVFATSRRNFQVVQVKLRVELQRNGLLPKISRILLCEKLVLGS